MPQSGVERISIQSPYELHELVEYVAHIISYRQLLTGAQEDSNRDLMPKRAGKSQFLQCHQTMELLGGIASVTQLAAYSHVVTKRLIQLHKAAQEGPSFCKAQRFNIGFLLESIQRICTADSPNTESVLPLLISTANCATLLLSLLRPKGTVYNYLLWASKGQEIEAAFRALNEKTRLLQIYISERTYSLIRDVQRDIEAMNQSVKALPSPEDQPVRKSIVSMRVCNADVHFPI